MGQTEQSSDETKTNTQDAAIKSVGVKSLLGGKAELQRKLEEAKKAYFDAPEKVERGKAREKMVSLSKELFSLQEKVINKQNGELERR